MPPSTRSSTPFPAELEQAPLASSGRGRAQQQKGHLVHPWFVQAEGEVVAFPSRPVEAWARFDDFFEEEHERLYKALYFVTGNRADAAELMQDAFLKLWER